MPAPGRTAERIEKMNKGFDTLRYGSRGAGVRRLQLALCRAGFSDDDPDGEFGNSTVKAVRLFRAAHGLEPSGEADSAVFELANVYLEGFIRVRLKPRDTFYRLGKKFGVSADAVAAANPGLDPADLSQGREAVIPLPFAVTPKKTPMDSALAACAVRGLAARYPFIRLEEYGKSVLGRPLFALSFGRGKELLISAAVHANEWITAMLLLDFAESIAGAYAGRGTFQGRSAAALLSRVRLTLCPLANPDGVDLVTGALPRGAYEAARRIAEDHPDLPFPSGWKANISGVDLNLNFPVRHGAALAAKRALGVSGPAPRDWAGEAALCAPETSALADLTKRLDPFAVIALHTQGGEVLWKSDLEEAPAGAERMAEAMAEAAGYEARTVEAEHANGGWRDWFAAEFRRPGFTVEAGRGANPLPLSQYGGMRTEVFPLLAAAMEG